MGQRNEAGDNTGTQEDGGERDSLGDPLVEPLTPARFAEALMECLPRLRAAACKLAPTRADAADLVQATVLRAFEKRDRFTFESEARFRGWLVAIMHNIQCDLARKRRREVLKPTLAEVPDDMVHEPTPPWRVVGDEVIEQAVRALPPKLQRPYLLFALDGLSYSDIAARLRVCSATVGTRIHRARKQLRVGIESWTEASARRAA